MWKNGSTMGCGRAWRLRSKYIWHAAVRRVGFTFSQSTGLFLKLIAARVEREGRRTDSAEKRRETLTSQAQVPS